MMCGVTDLMLCAISNDKPIIHSRCRTINRHALVASFLTVAGILDMLSGILLLNQQLSDSVSLVAAHFYFLEASVSLFGLVCCYCIFHDDEHIQPEHNIFVVYFLHRCGDVLFFTGSLIDLVCSYFFDNSESMGNVFYWTLMSSILWTVDSLLYITGDLIMENSKIFTVNENTVPINKEIELS